MRIIFLMEILLLLFLILIQTSFAQTNTGVPAIDTLKRYDWDIDTKNNSLPLTLGAALVFPGGGQFYTGHYVRGGFLLAFEGALIYETFYNKFRQNDNFNKNIKIYRDSVNVYKNLIAALADSLDTLELERLKDMERSHKRVLSKEESAKRASKDLWTSEFAWLAGLHIYGLFDAYGIWRNNNGHSHETHSIFSAVWRAAVFPGWGQMYNDEWGKAGLLYMGLFGSAVSYWSRQKMVEYHLEKLRIAKAEEDLTSITATQEDVLFFRKKRNQYIWAALLFYIYSIGDAAVDAMMHDFDSPAYFVLQPTFKGGFNAEAGFNF